MYNQAKIREEFYSLMQFEKWHFLRDYNFWTNDLTLILKTPPRPYSCLEKVIISLQLV